MWLDKKKCRRWSQRNPRPESRVTPVGEDAQHFQLESAIANRVASSLESYRSLESATFRVVWEASGSVRLGVIKSSGTGYELVSGTRSLPLTCASAASASIARLVGDPGGNMRSNSLVAWAEAGAVQVFGFELFATPTAGIGVAGRWESQ